jgi:hypothetical protein
MAFKQGFFKPKRPAKYKGDPTNIVYRSSWELKYMNWCDLSDSVIEWQSEEMFIPYVSPIDGCYHRYFPDFKVKVKTKRGVETWVIEIKPMKQTLAPKVQKKKTKRYINEVMTYAKNDSKWKAAEKWCQKKGYRFQILTEKELGI